MNPRWAAVVMIAVALLVLGALLHSLVLLGAALIVACAAALAVR